MKYLPNYIDTSVIYFSVIEVIVIFYLENGSYLSTGSLFHGLILFPDFASCEERPSSLSLCSFTMPTSSVVVGPWSACMEMRGSVPMFLPILCMLLSHHSPTGITVSLMRELLNPNFSITYHSVLLSFIHFLCWSCASVFTRVNFLILFYFAHQVSFFFSLSLSYTAS